ncbi:hypothetical protein EK904_008175 [Melospiza melodia maxima]|nr:hypothetical protein EK904_008175 [Melospiza melodia maxima]
MVLRAQELKILIWTEFTAKADHKANLKNLWEDVRKEQQNRGAGQSMLGSFKRQDRVGSSISKGSLNLSEGPGSLENLWSVIASYVMDEMQSV